MYLRMIDPDIVGKLKQCHNLSGPGQCLLLNGVRIADVGVYNVIEGVCVRFGGGEFVGYFIGLDGNFTADCVFHCF